MAMENKTYTKKQSVKHLENPHQSHLFKLGEELHGFSVCTVCTVCPVTIQRTKFMSCEHLSIHFLCGVRPGQAVTPSQGHTETNNTNNLAHSQSILDAQ